MNIQLSNWKLSGQLIKHGNDNFHVFCKDIGDFSSQASDTLLMLHGFPESSFSFHKVVDKLQARFKRIVLFDFLGFGFSDKPVDGYNYSILDHADLAINVWSQLGIKGGHLLGHDMGTSVVTELHSRYHEGALQNTIPEGFKSLSFTNGSMVIKYAKLRFTQKLLLRKYIGPILAKALNFPLFNHQIRSAHGNENLSKEDMECLWQQVKYNNGNKISHLLIKYYLDRIEFEQNRWLADLSNTQCKVNLCWGIDDQVARIEMAYYLKELIGPNSQLKTMKGLGHFGQLGSPETWANTILSFEY